jgi:hypothetical protein
MEGRRAERTVLEQPPAQRGLEAKGHLEEFPGESFLGDILSGNSFSEEFSSGQAETRREERPRPGEWPYQRDLLQAAARWATEGDDEKMLPPLTGAKANR